MFLMQCSSVQPKPGFGIGNRNQSPISVSVTEPKMFFSKKETFMFPTFFLRICVFRSLKINPDLSHLKCGFGIGYGIGQKYQPIWVSVLVLDLNQNNVFSRTLSETPSAILLPSVVIDRNSLFGKLEIF